MAFFAFLHSFFLSPTCLWLWVCIILGYALFTWGQLYWDQVLLSSHMQKANAMIRGTGTRENFSQHFTKIQQTLAQLPYVQAPWIRFSTTCYQAPFDILQATYSSGAHAAGVVYSSEDAGDFFHFRSLVEDVIPVAHYRATSQHLLRMGFLGALAWVACGAWLLRSEFFEPIEQAKETWELVLQCGTFAALSLFAGLLASLLFSTKEKQIFHALQQQTQRLSKGIMDRVVLQKTNDLHWQQVSQQKQLVVASQTMTQTLVQMKEALQDKLDIDEQLEKFVGFYQKEMERTLTQLRLQNTEVAESVSAAPPFLSPGKEPPTSEF
jgi:signal transduction histidine kinase